MPSDIKPTCVICAWRAGCQKQYIIANPASCPDFSRDLSVGKLPGEKGIKVLVQGLPGSGKTTLIERALVKVKSEAGGFITREMRESGERVGFRIITLDKEEGTLAHVRHKGEIKVGRYAVNLEALESVGVAAVERAMKQGGLIVIDEIGKMELASRRFAQVVEAAMESDKSVLATVPLEGPAFVEKLKTAEGVHLLTLTPGNRDDVLAEVVSHLVKDAA